MRASEDGADLCPTIKLLDNVGTIQVDFFRSELGPDVPWVSRGTKDMDVGQLPKGCDAHQISYVVEDMLHGATVLNQFRSFRLGHHEYINRKRLSGIRAKLLDPKDRPYASFIFRYQSRGKPSFTVAPPRFLT